MIMTCEEHTRVDTERQKGGRGRWEGEKKREKVRIVSERGWERREMKGREYKC